MSIPGPLLSDKTVQSVRHGVFDFRKPFSPEELDVISADEHARRVAKQLKRNIDMCGDNATLNADIRSCTDLVDQRICCTGREADILGQISHAEASRQKRIWRRARTELHRQRKQVAVMAARQQSRLRHA